MMCYASVNITLSCKVENVNIINELSYYRWLQGRIGTVSKPNPKASVHSLLFFFMKVPLSMYFALLLRSSSSFRDLLLITIESVKLFLLSLRHGYVMCKWKFLPRCTIFHWHPNQVYPQILMHVAISHGLGPVPHIAVWNTQYSGHLNHQGYKHWLVPWLDIDSPLEIFVEQNLSLKWPSTLTAYWYITGIYIICLDRLHQLRRRPLPKIQVRWTPSKMMMTIHGRYVRFAAIKRRDIISMR